MSKLRKASIWITIGVGSLLIPLLAVQIILPRIIDLELVKDEIRSRVHSEWGVELDFKHVAFTVFPSPQLIVEQAELSIPPSARGKASSISIYPEILPLFLGKVQISSARLDAADLDYTLRMGPRKDTKSAQTFSVYDLGSMMQSASALLGATIPNLDVQLSNAKARLFDGSRELLEVREIDLHLQGPPDRREIAITSSSDLWRNMSMTSSLDTGAFKGGGQLQITQFRPQGLTAHLFPDTPIQITDTSADISIDFKADGPGRLQAEGIGSIPDLRLSHEKEKLDIKNARVKASVLVDGDSLAISVSELALEYPQLKLSANLTVSQGTPSVKLQIKAEQIDAAATRPVALMLIGKNHPFEDIFESVRGGKIPSLTLQAQGQSLSDLANTDNMLIRGQLREGEILTPKVQLDLVDASGDFVISHGVLNGKNLQARLGNSLTQNGKLSLGLVGEGAPLHLETDFQADLSELPRFMERQIDDKDIRKQLALLEELKGSAYGKLVLGGNKENMTVKVDTSKLYLTAGHRKIPLPLKITNANLSYAENRIHVRRLSGTLGRSSFSGISGGIDLGRKHYLEIDSGESRLHLAELVPWLASLDELRELHKYYGGGEGTVSLSEIRIKGPLSAPHDWYFDMSGSVKDLVLKNLPQHPEPVTISSARFKLNPQRLIYTDAHMTVLDANLTISGHITSVASKGMWFDTDMAADNIRVDHMIQALEKNRDVRSPSLPLKGVIRFKAEQFTFGDLTWSPLHAEIVVMNDTTDVLLKKVGLCSISQSGTLKLSPQGVQFKIRPIAKDQDVSSTLNCFSLGKFDKVDGKYSLESFFQGTGKAEELLKTSTGHGELSLQDGRIYHDVILLNILKYFKVSGAFKGGVNAQEMERKGMSYNSIRVKAKLQNGKILYEKIILDSNTIIITGSGEHNLLNGQLDLKLLVSPLVTLDRLLEDIPLIGGVLETLDTIPIGVKGTHNDIDVHPLAPSAVGRGLKQLMEETAGVPLKLIHLGS